MSLENLANLLLAWYSVEQRELPWRKTGDPYSIWVSEVMLQQTQVKTVIPYYERFLQRFPSVESLGTANLDDVLTVWRGLGYYSRARRMWEGARYLLAQKDGKMPCNYQDLLLVPGIGRYTAGAIASIAFGQSVVAIDGNVLRVVSRLLAWSESVETVHTYRHFSDHLLGWQPYLQPGDFNQAMMELGATVCTPSKPNCGNCPLAQVCLGHGQNEVMLYPVKKSKAPRQIKTRLTFILRQEDRVYLMKRPSQGLLADMWEFPGVEFSQNAVLNESLPVFAGIEEFEFFQKVISTREFDARVREQFERGLPLHGPIWYTFSHRRWKLVWVILDLNNHNQSHQREQAGLKKTKGSVVSEASEDYRLEDCHGHESLEAGWISLQDLGKIPLPVAFSAIVEELTK